MALYVTEEDRNVLKDEFINENQSLIAKYEKVIHHYINVLTSPNDIERISKIFYSAERIEQLAIDILFKLSTTVTNAIPLQSMAGMISNKMSYSDSLKDRTEAMLTAMELLYASAPFVENTLSKRGYMMARSVIASEDTRTKNIYLPLDKPTTQHKQLGSFNWTFKNFNAIDKLNKLQMKIVNVDDPKPEEIPDNNIYNKEALKQQELLNKWKMRKGLKEIYKNKTIYFNWAVDYRMRMYPVGYYLNPQGTDIEKNNLGFANGERLTFHGLLSLQKAIASAYGLSKRNDREKLEWFYRNKDTLHLRKSHAKEPATFSALLYALKDHLNGEKVHHAIGLDATNSQAQLLSVLTKNRKVAETCNVVNTYDKNGNVEIADLYQLIADEMSNALIEENDDTRKLIISRSEIKSTLMQAGYGQKEKGSISQLKEDLCEKYNDKMYRIFINATEKLVPGFFKIMEMINSLWNENWEQVKFMMPDGIVVTVKPTTDVWHEFKLFDKLKIVGKVSGVKKEKMALILYVSIIHATDAYIARRMIDMADFDMWTIHDDFRCHPNNVGKMKENYNKIIAEINDSNLLTDILTQITGKYIKPISGNLKRKDILESEYSIS
jgi:hypothetical protein